MTNQEKRQRIIDIAVAQIGIKENPAGSNKCKFNTWFYGREVYDGDKPGAKYPWCFTSVSWVFNEAGLPLGTIDYLKGGAGCPYALQCLTDPKLIKKKKWGEFVSFDEALPGDLVFYDWDLDGKWDHVAILKSKNAALGSFQALEGNTSFKNQSNGGEYMLRDRMLFPGLKFVRPNVLK